MWMTIKDIKENGSKSKRIGRSLHCSSRKCWQRMSSCTDKALSLAIHQLTQSQMFDGSRISKMLRKQGMAHELLPNWPNISSRNAGIKQSTWVVGISNDQHRRRKYAAGKTRFLERKSRGYDVVLQCCCSSSFSSTTAAAEAKKGSLVDEGIDIINKGKSEEYVVIGMEEGWNVRKIAKDNDDEMRKVALIQAEAFHVPVALFNDLFFQFFQAEVLAELLDRVRNSPPDRYACLVAETSSENDFKSSKEVVGVVDITICGDKSVLQHLHGSQEYLYVSGIAVSNNFRRRKVATALLKACDMLSIKWGFEYLALWANEDDLGARKLYTNAGYNVVSSEPPWKTTWIGKRRGILMIKRV